MPAKTIQKLIKLLKHRNQDLTNIMDQLHPTDLAEILEHLEEDQKKELFDLLNDEEAALVIQEMEDSDQVSLFKVLDKERASSILKEMSSDEAVDLLSELPQEDARELLIRIEDTEEIEGLLKYAEDTAGGLMTTEYIALPENMHVEEAILRLREVASEVETVYYIYVIDEENRLIGVLSLRELISAQDGSLLADVMRTNVISVGVDVDQEEVARLVSRYDLLAIPVIDVNGSMRGIITVDDILDVVEEEATEDIYHFAGTSEVRGVDLVNATVFQVASKRLPWLLVCLVGGFFSGIVIRAFENTLEAIVVLAFFIPVIMDMGGNVGTQSSTVFVRSLATGEIESDEVWGYFFKEIRVGFLMGLVCGVSISLAANLWQQDFAPWLGLVVGIAMFSTVTAAAIIGTLVPLLFWKMGADPALTAGPFVTTIKDVTGLLIYFYTAALFMDKLT